MFPFSLNGTQFLVFYAVLALAVLVAYGCWLLAVRSRATGAGGITLDALTADPYRIACLRDGPDEAVRVAVVNLVDRGLLVKTKGSGLRASLKAHPDSQRRSLDQVILGQCKAAPMSAADILADRTVRAAAAAIETDLQAKGLLLSTAQRAARANARRLVLLLLAGVALVRIAQALQAGRSNIGFLLVMAVCACGMALMLPQGRITGAGERGLSALRSLLKRLKERATHLRPGGATNEAVLFAAVFGIHALPATAFPFVEDTFPRPKASSDSGGGSSDSSSSSDSGSCGGGGGSGCGGCGGGGGD